ncbi:MAG: CDGSH iron-sulfur domain-containing protein [Actinobacteria bacterium]|nr:CDGSH iron-sulfur domain-containing protein [Actinomycetota bacterium]
MSERPKIFIKPNGSIRVTGEVDFVDAEGKVIETKENFSLCRCGHSKEKPFCD